MIKTFKWTNQREKALPKPFIYSKWNLPLMWAASNKTMDDVIDDFK